MLESRHDVRRWDEPTSPRDRWTAAVYFGSIALLVTLVVLAIVFEQVAATGVLLVTFLVFSALMVFLDNRQSSQAAAAAATATEMQMLSQRLARGSALASQGQPAAFAAVKDSRERFKTDLEALLVGGTVRGVTV